VIQLDCPEDADTYIHRVGRTARFERDGRAVLFLEPSEEENMRKRLEQKKVPIEKINVKAKKQQSIRDQLQNMCFKEPELKYLGQKAFISYVKAVYVQKDKDVFKVKELPLEEYAASLGLAGAPRIKFINGEDSKILKNKPRALAALSGDDDSGEDGDRITKKKGEVRTKYDRMFERRNQSVLADHYSRLINDDGTVVASGQVNGATDDGDEDDGFLSVKRRFEVGDEDLGKGLDSQSELDSVVSKKDDKVVDIKGMEPLIIDSKRREKLLKSKKKLLKYKGKGTKLVYDEEGNPHEVYELEDEDAFKARGNPRQQRNKFLETQVERTRLADIADKEIVKQKKREKKEKRKARDRELNDEKQGSAAILVPYNEDKQPSSNDGLSEEYSGEKRVIKKQKTVSEDIEGEARTESNKTKSIRSRNTQQASVTRPIEVRTLEDLETLASGLLD
jgi:ATP-dependent RNA helicase DDX10/DBP4